MNLIKRIIIIFVIPIFIICILLAKLIAAQSNRVNIYENTKAGMLSDLVRTALPRVYVPNSLDNTVSVIDPKTYTVIDTFKTGKTPQHVVPSYDLKTLWVVNDRGNSLTPIDPHTAKPGKNVKVNNPYNLYFTPDGKFAIVVCEAYKRLEFRDPSTMILHDFVPVQCKGINHMEFTQDSRYAIVTCEFSGQLFKLDLATHQIVGYLNLILENSPGMSMPQDIRSSSDGRTFFVADMMKNGIFTIDPINFQQTGFIPTGIGTHSIYPSRDGNIFYVANRGCNFTPKHCPKSGPGSITVLNPNSQKVISNWPIPGGGSPDMGNVSEDGKELWLSGRFDNEVYVFDTATGQLTHRIPVGRGPHGLTVWPQPGKYSLGHTGNMR